MSKQRDTERSEVTRAALKLSFDGKGINDANSEYRERIATISNAYMGTDIGERIVRAVNSHSSLVAALQVTHSNILSLKAAKYPENFDYYDKWLETVEQAISITGGKQL